MANFAYVENNNIISVYDLLPESWNNISNFHVLDDATLQSLGWYKIQHVTPPYDVATQKLDNPIQYFQNGVAYQSMSVIDLPPPAPGPTPEEIAAEQQQVISNQWNVIRQQRDNLMNSFEWRLSRYNREVALGKSPTTDNIVAMQTYMQALADIPEKNSDPFNVVFPTFGE